MATVAERKAAAAANGRSDGRHVDLYKKYRPRTWDDVVGQDMIVDDLRNAVLTHTTASAYLFAGERGTGKTSVALILAKALNCSNLQPDGNPCNKCEMCRAIDNEDTRDAVGVHYVSMANYGTVDKVREIAQNAQQMSRAKHPVWILDEVHNLKRSAGAFDALLIPLERENMPSTFILATTEPNNIPATIRSRVQQRRFNLVPGSKLGALCVRILKKEGWTVTDNESDPAKRIASKKQIMDAMRLAGMSDSGGSVRETLSALERVVNSREVPKSYATMLLGAMVAKRSVPEAYAVIGKAIGDSEDPRNLAAQLMGDLRSLMFLANGAVQRAGGLHMKGREEVAQRIGSPKLVEAMYILGGAIERMQWGVDTRIELERAVTEITWMLTGKHPA